MAKSAIFCLANTVSGRYKNPLGIKSDKAVRLTRQGSQVVKAARLTRQPGCQGSQAVKAARLSRQPGRQDRQADSLTKQSGLPVLFLVCLLCYVPSPCTCSLKWILY
jgi:hypothetical protein